MGRTLVVTGSLVLTAVAVALHLGCDRQEAATPSAAPDAQVKTVTVTVEGMSCAACVASVRKNLTAIDGVAGVEVSLERRHATVRYDEQKVSPERIAESIRRLGYKAGEPKVEAAR